MTCIGVPKEIKTDEYRVGLTPQSVRELTHDGHAVVIETGAGAGIGFSDALYEQAGASIAKDADTVFAKASMIVKVKEPQPIEYTRLNENHLLFTYLHLAPDLKQTKGLMQSGCTAIAYETIRDANGKLPLLTPMSEVAGRLSIQAAAYALEKPKGGKGLLLGGVPGVKPCNVLIIGGGVVGQNAAQMAIGLGANVIIMDKSLDCLRYLHGRFGTHCQVLYASNEELLRHLPQSDVIVGSVLIPGDSAPKLIMREQLSLLKPGTVLVDVAIDQGGCFETSKPTTHSNPTFEVDGIIHYCVANMPGAVAQTASMALNHATLPFVQKLATMERRDILNDPMLLGGLNIASGKVVHKTVANALNLPYSDPKDILA